MATETQNETRRPATRERLAGVPAFSSIRGDSAERLVALAQPASASPNGCLARKGEAAATVFVSLSGHVGVYAGDEPRGDQLIDLIPPANVIGLAEACLGQPHPYSYFASDDVDYLAIPTDGLIAALQDDTTLLRSMLGALSLRLHGMVAQISALKTQRADRRLAEHLLALIDENDGETTFRLTYDKRTLAAHLGIAPESLSRSLAKLKDLGVELRGRRVHVEDPERLREFSES